MQAVIIAGGKGTRLRPLTYGCPKPMLPLFERPFLEWMIERCRAAEISDILLNVHYQAKQIVDYFGDGDRWGVKISYIEESTPLDTAGAIKLAEPLFTGAPLVVFNADILTDLNLTEMIAYHRSHQAKATLALTRVDDITPFGLVEINQSNQVLAFREKPTKQQAELFLAKGINTINSGTYILEPGLFKNYAAGQPLSFERQFFPDILAANHKMIGFVSDSYWLDLGTPQKYWQAHSDILLGLMPFDLEAIAHSVESGIWVSNSAKVENGAKLHSPCFIGADCFIGSQAIIPPHTIIGANSAINSAISAGIYPAGCLLIESFS